MPEIRVRHLDPSSLEVTPIGRTALLDEPITIGRASENDIVLSTNRVSRAHCVVEPTAHGFRVRDTGSTFGTMVNGERVDIQILASGDVIGIAGFELQYVEPERDTALLPPDPEEQQCTIDALIAQRDAAAAERDAAYAERDDVIRERDAALDAGDAAAHSRAALIAERDAARAETRSAQDALDVVRAERQAADDQRSAAQRERDDARQRVQTLEHELEALRNDIDDTTPDDDPSDLDAERARWASTRAALESTIDALESDLARVAAERDAARAERNIVTDDEPADAADAPDDEIDVAALQNELDALRAALDAERSVAASAVAERDALRDSLDATPVSEDPPFDPARLVAHLDAVREMARHLLNVDAVLRQREDAFAELDASVRAAESDDGENIDLELLNARDLEAAAFEAAHDDRDAALGALRERLDALDHTLADDAPRDAPEPPREAAPRRGGWIAIGLAVGILLGAGLGAWLAPSLFAGS